MSLRATPVLGLLFVVPLAAQGGSGPLLGIPVLSNGNIDRLPTEWIR